VSKPGCIFRQQQPDYHLSENNHICRNHFAVDSEHRERAKHGIYKFVKPNNFQLAKRNQHSNKLDQDQSNDNFGRPDQRADISDSLAASISTITVYQPWWRWQSVRHSRNPVLIRKQPYYLDRNYHAAGSIDCPGRTMIENHLSYA
jgi:hypothetical protein